MKWREFYKWKGSFFFQSLLYLMEDMIFKISEWNFQTFYLIYVAKDLKKKWKFLKKILLYVRPGNSFTAARNRERPWVLRVAKWPFMRGRWAATRSRLPGCRTFSRPAIRTRFLWVMWPFGTEFAKIFQKLRILGGTILRLVTMSFLAHFCKKLTFYFASRDFNFGNFVMKLSGEEVNIVTYLHVLKN